MKQNILSIPTKITRRLSTIVVLMMLLPSFNFYLSNILQVWGVNSFVVIIYGALLLMMIYGVYIGGKYSLIKKSAIVISVILVLMGFLSYFIYGDAIGQRLIRSDFHILYSELLYLLIFSIPALLITSAVRDWDMVVNTLIKFSPLIVVMALYAWYLVGFRTWGEESMNYMTLSYHVLTAGCVCIAVSFTGFKPVYWIASLVFMFIMIGSGCRGALVCVILFVILLLVRRVSINPHSKSSRLIRLACILLVVSLPILYTKFFTNIANMFEKIGITSRVIETLEESEFLSSDSRENIRNAIMEGIRENPFGYGLYGDRYVTIGYYQGGAEYAHNIFFEFLADFGVFLGPLFFLFIIQLCYKIFRRNNETNVGYALILLFPAGFAKFFFSSSYLINLDFFIFVGFLLSCMVGKKNYYITKSIIKKLWNCR